VTAALPGADVLLVWDFRASTLSQAWPVADALRWVHAASAGVNHVLAMALALAKDLPTTLDRQRERRWHHRETERLGGKRALVAGTGPIGRAIGRKLAAPLTDETRGMVDATALWEMPNVIVSPHMSGDVVGWQSELVALFLDNLTRYLDGEPLRNVVDKARGYVRGKGSP
jgi:phosphoglycerate dehydrogenase-like enzyme